MIEKTYPLAEKTISDALVLAEQLYKQLHLEAEALKKKHNESFESIAANKKQLVVKLDQLNTQLSRILNSENLPNSKQGLSDYFQRAEAANLATADSAKNWQALLFICAESKNLNEQNGASLDLLSRHINRSLQILKGKTQTPYTYGPDGAAKSPTYARTLVLA